MDESSQKAAQGPVPHPAPDETVRSTLATLQMP